MIRTKPPSNDYRDGWDRVFGDDEKRADSATVEQLAVKMHELGAEANSTDEMYHLKRSPGWPTSHESDCPARIGDPCRCPMGNL